MELTRFDIEYKYGETIKIKNIIDPHIGAAAADIRSLKACLQDSDEKTFFLNIGDLFDGIIFTDKRYEKGGDAFRHSNSSAIIDDQVDFGRAIIEPYASKFIGLGLGNHERTCLLKHGTNPIRRICGQLSIPYLGYSGLIRVYLHEKGNTRGRSVIIRYHHGFGGGGRTGGSSITKYERQMADWDADIFVFGHDHNLDAKPYARYSLAGNSLIYKPKWLIIGGTYLETMQVGGDPTYAEVKGYRPVPIGGTTIEITPDSKWAKINVRML